MLVISNNCVAADLYYTQKLEYNHPFMWSILLQEDLYSLIKNWESLDFKKYKILENKDWKDKKCYDLIIDNLVKVKYGHYLEDKNYDIPTKTNDIRGNERNISYKNIKNYVEEKYLNRISKLPKEKPIFIIHYVKIGLETNNFTEEEIQKIIDLCNKKDFKLIIIGNYDKLKLSKNIKLIHKYYKWPSQVIKNHFKEILEFINE